MDTCDLCNGVRSLTDDDHVDCDVEYDRRIHEGVCVWCGKEDAPDGDENIACVKCSTMPRPQWVGYPPEGKAA